VLADRVAARLANHGSSQLIQTARKNAKRRGHIVTIDLDWVRAQPLVCPYFKFPLVWTHATRDLRKPSLDRIDNAKGYTPENTRLTSLAWNYFRNQAAMPEADAVLREIRRAA
jgi:hypothetical protein